MFSSTSTGGGGGGVGGVGVLPPPFFPQEEMTTASVNNINKLFLSIGFNFYKIKQNLCFSPNIPRAKIAIDVI